MNANIKIKLAELKARNASHPAGGFSASPP